MFTVLSSLMFLRVAARTTYDFFDNILCRFRNSPHVPIHEFTLLDFNHAYVLHSSLIFFFYTTEIPCVKSQ